MTNERKTKRSWLQFHLSTAVTLMFVASVLIWANTRERRIYKTFGRIFQKGAAENEYILGGEFDLRDSPDGAYWLGYRERNYGLPYDAMHSWVPVRVEKNGKELNEDYTRIFWNVQAIILNVLIATIVFFAVWFICEWWIRR